MSRYKCLAVWNYDQYQKWQCRWHQRDHNNSTISLKQLSLKYSVLKKQLKIWKYWSFFLSQRGQLQLFYLPCSGTFSPLEDRQLLSILTFLKAQFVPMAGFFFSLFAIFFRLVFFLHLLMCLKTMLTFHLVFLFSLELSYNFTVFISHFLHSSVMFSIQLGYIVLMSISYLGNLSWLSVTHCN